MAQPKTRLSAPIEYAITDPSRRIWRTTTGHPTFDALRYAERLLRVLAPARMKIAVCPERTHNKPRVLSGPAWGDPQHDRWAMFIVPRSCTRDELAVAALEFATPFTHSLVLTRIMRGLPDEVAL